ncbi:hypothetical protein, variant [Puccinia triticina 1-1 BBBD Race 1]|uniref:Uncharacterized protein n=1 Tax=Puccinia triticina (isolate 1-1 / race 1 (BBBD)) TaxID=630390 RepID=A0A180GPR3_PUCT1|nr:hypothetical protein, variant [Puccinia triticina 1-1 BBBD Race 1]
MLRLSLVAIFLSLVALNAVYASQEEPHALAKRGSTWHVCASFHQKRRCLHGDNACCHVVCSHPMRHSWWIALKDKCDALHHKPKRAKTPPPVNPPQTIVVTAPPPPTAYLVQPQPAVVYAQPAQVPAQAH